MTTGCIGLVISCTGGDGLGFEDFDREMRLRDGGREFIDPEWLEQRDSGYLAWTDKAGVSHPLKDMTDDYIANVSRFLRKCMDNIVARYQRKTGYNYGRQERDNLFRDWDDDCDESYWPQEYL